MGVRKGTTASATTGRKHASKITKNEKKTTAKKQSTAAANGSTTISTRTTRGRKAKNPNTDDIKLQEISVKLYPVSRGYIDNVRATADGEVVENPLRKTRKRVSTLKKTVTEKITKAGNQTAKKAPRRSNRHQSTTTTNTNIQQSAANVALEGKRQLRVVLTPLTPATLAKYNIKIAKPRRGNHKKPNKNSNEPIPGTSRIENIVAPIERGKSGTSRTTRAAQKRTHDVHQEAEVVNVGRNRKKQAAVGNVEPGTEESSNYLQRSARKRGLHSRWAIDRQRIRNEVAMVLIKSPANSKKALTRNKRLKPEPNNNDPDQQDNDDEPKTKRRRRKNDQDPLTPAQTDPPIAKTYTEKPKRARRQLSTKVTTSNPATSVENQASTSATASRTIETTRRNVVPNTNDFGDFGESMDEDFLDNVFSSGGDTSNSDAEWFGNICDPNFDTSQVKRNDTNLVLSFRGERHIEKTSFDAIRFHDINGVQCGFFPNPDNNQQNFGILRFLPHTKKPKTKCIALTQFIIIKGSFKFKIGRRVQKVSSGLVMVPAGENFEITADSDDVGIIQFLSAA